VCRSRRPPGWRHFPRRARALPRRGPYDMSQNTSHAVMAQRREPHDSLDHFPTPPWATRALCSWAVLHGYFGHAISVWEPACAEGYMARALAEYFETVSASDVHDYGFGDVRDFLIPMENDPRPDWIITNPPFRLAEQFIARASQLARVGFAMLVRTSFLEGVGRHRDIFSKNPPSYVLQFTERVPMHKGRLVTNGSTATAYCWLVWIDGEFPTRFDWIAPCRKRLERSGDYPEVAACAS
jgi:hypothetical protein